MNYKHKIIAILIFLLNKRARTITHITQNILKTTINILVMMTKVMARSGMKNIN